MYLLLNKTNKNVFRNLAFAGLISLTLAPVPPVRAKAAEGFSTPVIAQTVNQVRSAAGLATLATDACLTRAAEAKLQEMLELGYWGHYRPSDGAMSWRFLNAEGCRYTSAGENLARGFSSTQQVVSAWEASPAHARNLLDARFTAAGYASGTNAEGKVLTVQLLSAMVP